jgi:dihydrofolate reductase
MGKVIVCFAMSLDGFIADQEDGVHQLFRWLSNGDTPVPGIGDMVFNTSPASAEHYSELFSTTGANITGRRDFDISKAWGGENPLGVPIFIVTHNVPPEWAGEGSPFNFVTEGVASAIDKAKAVAGDKNVQVGGSKIVQQALLAGLIDEVWIDLVPILLGTGIRLFENMSTQPIELEITKVIDAPGVTHLRYRVVKVGVDIPYTYSAY